MGKDRFGHSQTGVSKERRFVRYLGESTISALRDSTFYSKRLRPDVVGRQRSRRVFPAIRRDRLDFYYGGGKLFSFGDGRFWTHIKYASVLVGHRGDYITEEDLTEDRNGSIRRIADFDEGYERIKENCRLYSGVEAEGVSCLYSNSAYVACADDVVVLDIEVSFSSLDRKADGGPEKADAGRQGSQDRIDLLLYHKRKRMLRFYEAKHLTNGELWSADGRPQVAKQLTRYNGQIKRRADEILEAYRRYVKIAKEVFRTPATRDLSPPEQIDPGGVVLLVFGYDRKQQGRIRELASCPGLKGHRLRARGSTKDATAQLIWRKTSTL